MSTAAPALEYEAAPTDASQKEKGGIVEWMRGHFFALGDQILISGANFVTGVLTAKALAANKAEFGIFSSIYMVLLFANIFQSTLITRAHNVIGASRLGLDYRRYTSSTAFAQLVVALCQALLVAIVALIAVACGWPMGPMMVALIPAIIFWQFQEFIRRVLYTEHRYTAAFVNDLVSYGGQAVVIVAMFVAHAKWGKLMTGAMTLYALAATSAAACLLGVWQIRRSLATEIDRKDITENWHFGKWLLGGELLAWPSQLPMQIWWVTLLLGSAAGADLRAVQILFGPTRVIAFFLDTMLPIRFSRALHKGGMPAMRNQVRQVYLALIPMAGTYCLLLALFPRPLLKLVYGSAYTDDAAVAALMLYTICAFVQYMQMVVQAALTASRHTRSFFSANFRGCIIALVLSPLLITLFGAGGAIVCIIIVSSFVTTLFLHSYRRNLVNGNDRAERQELEKAMTVLDCEVPQQANGFADAECDPRGQLLMRVLDVLDRDGLPYCILHGHAALPQQVNSDVDMLIPREMLPRRLNELLRARQQQLGARAVQWFADGAHFIVLSGRGADGAPVMLQLHVSSDYEVSDRVVFEGNDIIHTRRRAAEGFWVPAAQIEFASVLANRLDKGKLDERHTRRLSQLWAEEPARCLEQLERLFSAPDVLTIASAAETGNWECVAASVASLRGALRGRLAMKQPGRLVARKIARQFRRLGRWMNPSCGMHVVFLGPDGVGKSTVIDTFRERIAPAFLEVNYQTFARGILPTKPKDGPHSLKPRSLPASLVKAAWWVGCYGPGYFRSIWPTIARGGLAINHRYLIDAVVDPYRYRYSGPRELIRWIWAIVPKPDLIIFLDAPIDVICARKQEMPAEELAELRDGYLALAKTLPYARVISTNQSLEQTIGEVMAAVEQQMAARVARRMK